uniref:Protein slit n=1 Tax=Hemiscolopendra marginata TaxID=943146 RepID=A0A646QDU2_9MYRI
MENFYFSGSIFLSLLLVTVLNAESDVKCVSGLDFAPCKCLPSSKDLSCTGLKDGQQLKEAFAKKPKSQLDALYITNVKGLTSLPDNVLQGVSFKSFFISDTGLQTIEDGAFKGSEETTELLLLNQNKFKQFNFKSIQPLKKLSTFELSNDPLTSLPSEAFQKNSFLQFINLINNSIASLEKGTFADLSNIKTINLFGNKLKAIGEGVLTTPKVKNLISINLASNQISSIDKTALTADKVDVLDLENNQLTTFSKEVFEPILNGMVQRKSGGLIHTKGNPFKCDASIKWLVEKGREFKSHVTNFKCQGSGKTLNQLKAEDLKN